MKVMTFTFTKLYLEKIEGKDWKVFKDIVVCIYTKKSGMIKLTIKKGFVFDLGSIPARLQGIVNPGTCSQEALVAYLVHDLLYGTHYLSRDKTDNFLFQMLKNELTDRWDRYLAYWSVKLFGGGPWKKPQTVIDNNLRLSSIQWLDK